MRSIMLISFLGLILFNACSASKETATTTRYSRNYIALEEIRNSGAANAYELIQTLRPFWLRGRGRKSIRNQEASYPVIYVNGNKHGPIDTLYSISTENIKEIQYYSASEASIRFGLNHSGGVIMIIL